jgi:O-antigen biosynthesis protein
LANDISNLDPTADAETLLAKRRDLHRARMVVAEDRWNRFRKAAGKRVGLADKGPTEQRFDLMLARAKWPGRAALLARSGLWDFRLDHAIGRDGGKVKGLVSYVRAGPDAGVNPKALFDQAWYMEHNPDLAGSRWAPLAHYLIAGDKEGRSPHPLFDLKDYRSRHAVKVAATGLTALQHFLHKGVREGYAPHPLFDVRYYVGQSDEVAESGENPLIHYLREGWRKGYQPHPLFNGEWYLATNPDVAEIDAAPLLHYAASGAFEGRSPHPLFDPLWYADRYREAAPMGTSPLAHFLAHGFEERRDPSIHFDTAFYLEQQSDLPPDVHPVVHYLTEGAFEGVSPAADFNEVSYLLENPHAAETPVSSLEHWALSRAPKPEAGAIVARPRGEAGLFEQLRAAGRARDAGAYDNQAYRDTRAAYRRIRQRFVEDVKVAPFDLIKISEREAEKVAAELGFTAPAKPRVSIVIPAYRNLTFTLECLAALKAAGDLADAEVIVIDDASGDGSDQVVAKTGVKLLVNNENLGFIRTCNRAAKEARGEFLIFLNNDVQVRPGWLPALLRPFAEEEAVGASAPKMLFPDGRLQEAGARIGVDGASEMIGLFEDPDLPRWNVRREVDYASGACLAVRREVFAELDGFDVTFVPAYCEDADLCFRLRERGLRIFYEPTSAIVHHLSVTSNSIDSGYKHRLAVRNQQKFVERWGHRLESLNQIRTIAFHLPQFHTVAENDRWWGPGFTEWTNVSRALPNYRGHYQPHVPADLGFYDLSDPAAMRRQAELAARYGIGGFCHYFYWFTGGRRILEKPLEPLLDSKSDDFPFCLCWANENWTRTWDGQERDVLLAQTYEEGDAEASIATIEPFLRQPNYIRIGGRPLLLIYRPGLLPDPKAWAEAWRSHCREAGIGEIYLAFVESFEKAGGKTDPASLGFDASVEFPPAGVGTLIHPPGPLFNARFEGRVNDYRQLVRTYLSTQPAGHKRFRGVMPSWDNTARRQDGGWVYQYASPGAFQAWSEAMFEETRRQNFGEERIVFVNAWNEWGEGAHLEPDQRFGHGWLEALKNAAESDLLDKS